MGLRAFGSDPANSRGRIHREAPSPWRTDFQRDRDRVIHATSFRRLKGKTQVFVAGEGDHYRTRLTHTLEVAQIARSLARALGLNEDLTEAIALAHDLGHPPFGHSGERALANAMAAHGGFDHNVQTLRVVTLLEHRYPSFAGLNLTWEVLEGLAKHNGPLTGSGGTLGDVALPDVVADIDRWRDLKLSSFPSAEAQCASLADDIAYDAHDIDDGVRAGLLDLALLTEEPSLARIAAAIERDFPGLDRERFAPELVRRLINWLVEDVLAEAGRRIATHNPASADEVRSLDAPIVAFSDATAGAEMAIKKLLNRRLYFSTQIADVMEQAERVVTDLFARYWEDDAALPAPWRTGQAEGGDGRARRIADFLAGMTDRFALAEYRRLFDRVPDFG
jgi:dGTPase